MNFTDTKQNFYNEKIKKVKVYTSIFEIGSDYVLEKNIYSTWNNSLRVCILSLRFFFIFILSRSRSMQVKVTLKFEWVSKGWTSLENFYIRSLPFYQQVKYKLSNQIFFTGNVIRGPVHRRNACSGNCPFGQLSRIKYLSEKSPLGKCPLGNCPGTKFSDSLAKYNLVTPKGKGKTLLKSQQSVTV